MRNQVSICLALAVGALFAGEASAAHYMITYVGTMTSGVDETNVFGLGVNADLAGQAVKIVFVTDPKASGAVEEDNGSTSNLIYNPSGESPVSARFFLNDVMVKMGDTYGITSMYDDGSAEVFTQTAYTHTVLADGWDDWSVTVTLQGLNQDFLSNYHWRTLTTDQAMLAPQKFGDLSSFTYRASTGVLGHNARGAFSIDSIRVHPVPEPSTWALTILGFGGAGAALRRRRAVAEGGPAT